ncbi:GNAT family N-acetyltransferase [Kribbella sp.]|uniref:GNAT family N-acetyltransferase n=1 Tax=Kribbella sp. TaxID=1871183 RepID=UPI002D434DCD|nr:GNAT family N-acetyltransferase [Kribbella sp.]HZX01506.1 GNAT family N-acetyltransferase [Kribbella sp.]
MHDEDLARWQRGWSAARGWNAAQRVDDVTVVRVGEPQCRVEYVATERDAAAAAHLALTDSNPPGTSWLVIATAEPGRVARELLPLEYVRTEWLMKISLPEQALHPVPAPYAVEVTGGRSVIDVQIYGYGELAASGRMAVLHTGAVADMIQTDPAHRRRGLARAVMSTLVTTAVARNTTTAHLSASPQGRPLYTSLGWTTLTPLLVARTAAP